MGERFQNNSFNAKRAQAREEEPKKEELAPRKVIDGEAKKIRCFFTFYRILYVF